LKSKAECLDELTEVRGAEVKVELAGKLFEGVSLVRCIYEQDVVEEIEARNQEGSISS
jgi:hypothetical protein